MLIRHQKSLYAFRVNEARRCYGARASNPYLFHGPLDNEPPTACLLASTAAHYAEQEVCLCRMGAAWRNVFFT